MNSFSEYDRYDAIALGELVKNRQVTPEELLSEAISRSEKLNPLINAVVTPMYDEARGAIAEGFSGDIFSGVPFLLKDAITAYKGVPMTGGSRACVDYVPDYDAEMVVRFKKAGLVIFAKTNIPEFCLMGVTESELFGPCRNPWNTNHTPGGSSGGSAAAIAAGIVPMASGNDGGGSIRIPASCCGLFGLKPTRGRNPSGPKDGRLWLGASAEGVISRSVRDSAAILDRTCGPDAGPPFTIVPPEGPYLNEVSVDPGRLKIAFCTRSPLGTYVHPECVKAVTNAAKALEDMGHIVEEAEPPADGERLAYSYFTMYYGYVAAELKRLKSMSGKSVKKRDLETITWTTGLLGRTVTAGDLYEAMNAWDEVARIMGSFHKKWDIYMTPTCAVPPVKIGELKPALYEMTGMKIINSLGAGKILVASGMDKKTAIKSLEKTPFTQLANFTGQPAMSVPLHWTPENLPVGVQFIAPFGDEKTLFRLAGRLEERFPWFDKRPGPE